MKGLFQPQPYSGFMRNMPRYTENEMDKVRSRLAKLVKQNGKLQHKIDDLEEENADKDRDIVKMQKAVKRLKQELRCFVFFGAIKFRH